MSDEPKKFKQMFLTYQYVNNLPLSLYK